MKFNYNFAALAAAALMAVPANAQNTAGEVLQLVEKNNTSLAAMRKRTEADQYGCRAERALDAPEVSFDYLWGSPADIGNRKDISVTQSVDIAALTGARGKLADSRSELSGLQYRIGRQNILLEAKQLYIKIVYCNAMENELQSRLARSAQVEVAYRDMQTRGETDMIEVNKAHLAYLAQKNALARNEVERAALLSELQRLNGGKPVGVNASAYSPDEVLPADFSAWYDEASQKSPELAYARKNVETGAAESRTAKMANYPVLTAGYMAELVKGSNFRGLTLGVSIPLWSVRSKVRQANASYEAAKLEERDASAQMYASLKALYDKTKGLQDMNSELSASMAVSMEAMALTDHKLKSGDISLIDNIMELSLYYSVADEALAVSRDYSLALAELYVWNL